MAHLLKLPQHACERGDSTVFESVLPGTLKRIVYIANADGATRGGHRHKTAWQALVCRLYRYQVYILSARVRKFPCII
ncbi:hypothetical protein [uncultured Fibrella sp.]|uniref:hypothetical protein n=1 Tax=uncultured Fibrella sp. TaxID=1284596 RepID=UPI0035CB07FD